jgi:hypothetical protein
MHRLRIVLRGESEDFFARYEPWAMLDLLSGGEIFEIQLGQGRDTFGKDIIGYRSLCGPSMCGPGRLTGRYGRVASSARLDSKPHREPAMITLNDLLQWDRFITPTAIRIFYWMAVGLIVLTGLSLIFSALGMMAVNFFAGFFMLMASVLYVCAGIIFVRIVCELVMVVFRINDHLGAIRDQGEKI